MACGPARPWRSPCVPTASSSAGNGPNALDFHIAFYIGRLAAAEPTAYFHIISKDAGFDPLIQHLKTQKVLGSRVKCIEDIPLLKLSNSRSSEERLEIVTVKLKQLKTSRPRTVKTLASTIAALFQKQLSDVEIASVIAALVANGLVAVTDNKVSYSLPQDS